MRQEQTLLIPIIVRACLCGQAPAKKIYSGFHLSFTNLADPDIPIDNGLFVPGNTPEPGVHLSFSLPEGFTRGIQEEKKDGAPASLSYPLVPNRWAVVRMWLEEGESRLKQKLFLLESDTLQKKRGAAYYNSGSSSWPWPQTSEKPYRYLGRSYALSQAPFVPQDVERIALTAVSPVNPFFSAYYPHCRNVFGFYDDLAGDGIKRADVSYLVCGWYQDAAGPEPLSLLTNPEQLKEQLLMDVLGTGLPRTSLCHGLLCGIEWKGADFPYPTGVPNDPQPGEVEDIPDLALGNTADEAAAALAKAISGISPRLFQCFLRNLCPDLLGQQGTAEVEKELHAFGFSTLQPPDIVCLSPIQGVEHKQPPSEAVMKKIADLRSRQRQLYADQMRHKQKHRAAYETWQLLFTGQGDPDSLYTALQKSVAEIQKEKAVLSDTAMQIDAQIETLDPGSGYELKTEPALPFYQPADPVLLIRQLADTEGKVTGNLTTCRRCGDISTAIRFSGLCASVVTVYAEELLENTETPGGLPAHLSSLIGEAALLSSGFASLIAKKALQKAGFFPPDPARTQELAAQLRQVQQQFLQLPSITFDRELPENRAVTVFKPRWYPLYLEWQCFYYPDTALLQAHPDLKNWSLEDGRYDYCGDPSILKPKNRQPISGRLLLSDNAARQLKNGIQDYLNILLPNDPRARTLLSQSLSGFNDTLLMRDQKKLLPQFSTDGLVKASLELLEQLSCDVFGTAAVYDQLFSPIRAGFLAFSKIRILDKLGRFQDILSPDLYCGEEMRSSGAPAKPHEAMLQPRLEQYTRLDAAWICATAGKNKNEKDGESIDGTEASFVPTASPLCGFLLPNWLDNSLMAYTAGGLPIGSLVLTQTGRGIDFKSPPGAEISHSIPEDINPQMYGLLHSLQFGPKENLTALLSYINQLSGQNTPVPHGPSEVEFIGHPLALCRLRLKLEQAGEPEAYRHLPGSVPNPSHAVHVTNAVFPLQIGDLQDYRDGMAGFYLNGDFSHLYIYPESATQASYFRQNNRIPSALDPRLPADELCVLMEPHGRLTIKPAILPVSTLSLPPELVDTALDTIRTTYYAGPLLSNETMLNIPAAYQNDRKYFFLQAGGKFPGEASSDASPAHIWKSTELGQTDGQAFSIPYPVKALEGYMQIQKNKQTGEKE